MATRKITVVVDADDYEKLQRMATLPFRPAAALIRTAISEFLTRSEQEGQK